MPSWELPASDTSFFRAPAASLGFGVWAIPGRAQGLLILTWGCSLRWLGTLVLEIESGPPVCSAWVPSFGLSATHTSGLDT